MPVCVAQTVQKGAVRGATVRHDGYLVSAACHRIPLAAQPPATYAWNGPRATRWWVSWSVGCGVVAFRGKRLAAVIVLSPPGACRSPGLAGARGASRQVSLKCLGWPSRQAPLAGVLC